MKDFAVFARISTADTRYEVEMDAQISVNVRRETGEHMKKLAFERKH